MPRTPGGSRPEKPCRGPAGNGEPGGTAQCIHPAGKGGEWRHAAYTGPPDAPGRELLRMKPPRDTGQRAAARALRDVHERFVTGEVDASALESSSIRPVVAKSWQRSRAKGVDPDIGAAPSSSAAMSADEPGQSPGDPSAGAGAADHPPAAGRRRRRFRRRRRGHRRGRHPAVGGGRSGRAGQGREDELRTRRGLE